MATIFLLLLLLPAIKAFSIHQLLILRFLRPVVYVTLQISRINSLCVYSWPLHFVSLDSLFVGQYSYDYAVPKKLCLD